MVAARVSRLVLITAVAATGAPWPEKFREVLSHIAAVCTALAVIVDIHFLSDERVGWMVQSATASAAIKAEVYKFLAKVGEYKESDIDPHKAMLNLRKECTRLARSVTDPRIRTTLADNKTMPDCFTTRDDYIKERVTASIEDFKKKAKSYLKRSAICSRFEWFFYTLAGNVPALLGIDDLLPYWIKSFLDGGAAAFISISVGFASHRERQRFEDIANEYYRTVDELENIREEWPLDANKAGSPEWEEQVMKTEKFIQSAYREWENIKRSTVGNHKEIATWKDDAVCGGESAVKRMSQLMKDRNLTEQEAKHMIMGEFPESFH